MRDNLTRQRVPGARWSLQDVCLHITLALYMLRMRSIEFKVVPDFRLHPFCHQTVAGWAVILHSGSLVHGVPPDIKMRFAGTDYAGNDGADADSCAELELIGFGSRNDGLHCKK